MFKTFIQGIQAGCYIAFGAFLALSIGGNIPGLAASNPGLAKLVFALVFPVGLTMVTLCGADLYTGELERVKRFHHLPGWSPACPCTALHSSERHCAARLS